MRLINETMCIKYHFRLRGTLAMESVVAAVVQVGVYSVYSTGMLKYLSQFTTT